MEKYKLAAQIYGFYDSPTLSIGDPIPVWYDLFKWGTQECWTQTEGQLESSFYIIGSLNEDKFDTLDKKMAYLKGALEGIKNNKLDFANSSGKVERIKKWVQDISHLYGMWGGILEHNSLLHTIPICHTLVFDPKMVTLINNFKLN